MIGPNGRQLSQRVPGSVLLLTLAACLWGGAQAQAGRDDIGQLSTALVNATARLTNELARVCRVPGSEGYVVSASQLNQQAVAIRQAIYRGVPARSLRGLVDDLERQADRLEDRLEDIPYKRWGWPRDLRKHLVNLADDVEDSADNLGDAIKRVRHDGPLVAVRVVRPVTRVRPSPPIQVVPRVQPGVRYVPAPQRGEPIWQGRGQGIDVPGAGIPLPPGAGTTPGREPIPEPPGPPTLTDPDVVAPPPVPTPGPTSRYSPRTVPAPTQELVVPPPGQAIPTVPPGADLVPGQRVRYDQVYPVEPPRRRVGFGLRIGRFQLQIGD